MRRQRPRPSCQSSLCAWCPYEFSRLSLLLLEFNDVPWIDLSTVYRAMRVRRDAFPAGREGLLLIGLNVRNEGVDDPVARAAHADTALPARMMSVAFRLTRLGVGHIQHIVLVDIDAAWPTELRPTRDKSAVLIKDLDAIVAAIADEQPSLRIHCEGVRRFELPRTAAVPTPLLHELSIFVEFDDASVSLARFVSIADKNAAVRGYQNGIGLMERIAAGTCDARLAKRAQQLSGMIELEHIVALAVADVTIGYPYVIGAIDEEAVRKEQQSATERLDEVAVCIKLHDWIDAAPRPGVGTAALSDPYM